MTDTETQAPRGEQFDGGAPETGEISVIGVIGAGTVGVGVAQAFAQAGCRVILVDVRKEALDEARRRIGQNDRFASLMGAAAQPGAGSAGTGDIEYTTDHGALAAAGYVVENIVENWPAKQALYQHLDEVWAPECILAVNTSAIPVTKVASATTRPDRVLGNHFMTPAHLMPTVEVVRGFHTSEQTLGTACALLARIGKQTVVVEDSPGFVTNRVAMLTVNEAAFLLQEGVSSAAQIDRLFRQCFGHSMGPLETADLIGLDTVLYSLEVLLEEFNDPKYRPAPLLRKHVAAGLLGRKTGRGFHTYAGAAADLGGTR